MIPFNQSTWIIQKSQLYIISSSTLKTSKRTICIIYLFLVTMGKRQKRFCLCVCVFSRKQSLLALFLQTDQRWCQNNMYTYANIKKQGVTRDIFQFLSGLFLYKFVEDLLVTVNGLVLFYTPLLGNSYGVCKTIGAIISVVISVMCNLKGTFETE